MDSLETFEKLILSQDRRGLGRAITLVESESPKEKHLARKLIENLSQYRRRSRRIGISGPPGVGKSSFIERFGLTLAKKGKSLAVLAIDPSSPVSGGSILGDKTRMQDLAAHDLAFIRPTPSGRTTGGVARYTREALLVLEAAGFDYIIVETVGVGQSEYTCESMVDLFITLHQPSSGDDLQGIKKGILELAQFVVITKADSHLEPSAKLAKSELSHAFHFLPPREAERKIFLCSALEGRGFEEILEEVESFFRDYFGSQRSFDRRKTQSLAWFEEELRCQFEDLVKQSREARDIKEHYLKKLTETEAASSLAASALEDIMAALSTGKASNQKGSCDPS